jgi:hypothetical protein
MAEYTGSGLVLSWVYSGGTVSLGGDFRTFTFNPTVDMIDTTAGSDPSRTFIPSYKTVACSVGLVAQTGGTALEDALQAGNFGTLTAQPEGTASGKRKYVIPCYSMGAQFTFPYDNLVEITCDFQPSGPTFASMITTN